MPLSFWPATVEEAVRVQDDLRHAVSLRDDFGTLRTVAGIDCSYDLARNLSRAVIVLMDAHTLESFYSVHAFAPTVFPYVPGFLSFREAPVILKALSCLPQPPDLLMVDGQGVAHPRRLGIAAHLGVLTGLPAIGVAKSLLTGRYSGPGEAKGDMAPLLDKGERIGTVLRSKEKCNPLFISPGHRVSQDRALAIVRSCLKTYRLPEPTRIADMMSKWKDVPQPCKIQKDIGLQGVLPF
jgi:deoxyribonuclease V